MLKEERIMEPDEVKKAIWELRACMVSNARYTIGKDSAHLYRDKTIRAIIEMIEWDQGLK